MVLLQLKDPLALPGRREELLLGSSFLSRRHMVETTESDVQTIACFL